mmetsp:Transcript_6324/g.12535  ORF Transcript_6324/g.12535 Transcript_6324/m.12535 type:complete len:688 (+) Transcript_6324:221-2284(+)
MTTYSIKHKQDPDLNLTVGEAVLQRYGYFSSSILKGAFGGDGGAPSSFEFDNEVVDRDVMEILFSEWELTVITHTNQKNFCRIVKAIDYLSFKDERMLTQLSDRISPFVADEPCCRAFLRLVLERPGVAKMVNLGPRLKGAIASMVPRCLEEFVALLKRGHGGKDFDCLGMKIVWNLCTQIERGAVSLSLPEFVKLLCALCGEAPDLPAALSLAWRCGKTQDGLMLHSSHLFSNPFSTRQFEAGAPHTSLRVKFFACAAPARVSDSGFKFKPFETEYRDFSREHPPPVRSLTALGFHVAPSRKGQIAGLPQGAAARNGGAAGGGGVAGDLGGERERPLGDPQGTLGVLRGVTVLNATAQLQVPMAEFPEQMQSQLKSQHQQKESVQPEEESAPGGMGPETGERAGGARPAAAASSSSSSASSASPAVEGSSGVGGGGENSCALRMHTVAECRSKYDDMSLGLSRRTSEFYFYVSTMPSQEILKNCPDKGADAFKMKFDIWLYPLRSLSLLMLRDVTGASEIGLHIMQSFSQSLSHGQLAVHAHGLLDFWKRRICPSPGAYTLPLLSQWFSMSLEAVSSWHGGRLVEALTSERSEGGKPVLFLKNAAETIRFVRDAKKWLPADQYEGLCSFFFDALDPPPDSPHGSAASASVGAQEHRALVEGLKRFVVEEPPPKKARLEGGGDMGDM